MNELIKYLLKFGELNSQEIDFINSKATKHNLLKGEFFSEAGKVPKSVGFVLDGVVRGYYHSPAGDEITRCFIEENSMLVDYLCFENETVCEDYLQAITDCSIVVFSRLSWNALSEHVAGWNIIKNKVVQTCMYQKSRKGPVISQDATTRYLEFLDNHPGLINRVPLSYIASYLGVTQQSLSRIRSKIR
ncbi:Crp/Fnr family transcriptional regulator [Dyadobacter tibetensis]|uniref:Crp/Fnr family transcriptional regulator n=1 Tax=Dyadobacter tibetensis TaxID=1211851 RepID=UPI0004725BCA|nr:Crp/Fnr family transcriptional regulator [Dyadobacter tibetensis]